MTAFVFNEELKERCLLLGASKCYTEFVDSTKSKDKRPFWYNTIEMPSNTHKNNVFVICKLIDSYLEEFEFLGFEDTFIDVSMEAKAKYVVYCFYYDKETFLKKVILAE